MISGGSGGSQMEGLTATRDLMEIPHQEIEGNHVDSMKKK